MTARVLRDSVFKVTNFVPLGMGQMWGCLDFCGLGWEQFGCFSPGEAGEVPGEGFGLGYIFYVLTNLKSCVRWW